MKTTVTHCDRNKPKDGNHVGWSKWLPWKLQGMKMEYALETTWALLRRRFCVDKTVNPNCIIEERQYGQCDVIEHHRFSKLREINNPICAQERSYEDCDIKIVP